MLIRIWQVPDALTLPVESTAPPGSLLTHTDSVNGPAYENAVRSRYELPSRATVCTAA